MVACSTTYRWVLGLALLMASCTDTALLDENVSIADHQWHYDDQPRLAVHVKDADKPYRVYLNLRHTPDYKYSNIFVLIHQRQPDGQDTTERVELRLAEPDGRWLGRGNGSVYAHQQLIKDSFRFPDTGEYVFTLEQNMRENPLEGVADVGIRVAPVEP